MLKKILRYLFSAHMTVICLLLMAVIVIWGTVYESSAGLYVAREKFFQSWLGGFIIPFPGIKLVSLLLIINLSGSFWRLRRKPLINGGLLLIHLGVGALLFGLIFSAQFTHEYYLPLQEGMTASSVYSPVSYEIAIYKKIKPDFAEYYTSDSIPVQHLTKGKTVVFSGSGITAKVNSIRKIRDPAMEDNYPVYELSLLLELPCRSGEGNEIVLRSGIQPVELKCNQETRYISLRPVAIPLPVSLQLVEFSKKFHPGTQMLKEVSSHLSIRSNNVDRDVIITMNKPLRHGSFTFYQASFSNQGGKEISNLSVVYNSHRLFPYIASILMIGGFFIHLILLVSMKYFKSKSKPYNGKKEVINA